MDPLRYSNFKQLSPHIMVDPSLLQKQAQEFIMDQEMTRGKLENSYWTFCGCMLNPWLYRVEPPFFRV